MTASHWELAVDPDEVHALLCSSDEYQGARTGSPVPQRNPATTAQRVRDGAVRLLREDGRLAAMFTLTATPSFSAPPDVFPPAQRPVYLSRLAVRPDLVASGSMAGVRCVRHAITVAGSHGADALHAEANPDLPFTVDMLCLLGFTRHHQVFGDHPRRVYLYRAITGSATA